MKIYLVLAWFAFVASIFSDTESDQNTLQLMMFACLIMSDVEIVKSELKDIREILEKNESA